MAREGFKKDEDITGLEAAVRSVAGLGVGYVAINNYRTIYDQVKRAFLGLPISPDQKRAFTRIFQFSGVDFAKIEMDTRLSLDKYMETISPQPVIDQTVEKIVERDKRIRFRLQQVGQTVRKIQDDSLSAARRFGAGTATFEKTVNDFVISFDQFANEYFEKAVSAAEQATEMAFAGRGGTRTAQILKDLRMPQINAIGSQLRVISERLRGIEAIATQTKENLRGMWNRGLRRQAQQNIERTTSGQMLAARQIAEDVLQETESIVKNADISITGLTKISLLGPQAGAVETGGKIANAIQGSPLASKMWAIKGDVKDLRKQNTLRRIIGTDAFRDVNQLVSGSFVDPFAPKTDGLIQFERVELGFRAETVRETKAKFFRYIAKTIQSLDNTGQFESLNIETSRGPVNQVILRGISKNPATFGSPDLLLRYDIPNTEIGISQLKSYDPKGSFVPFQRQRDIMVEQARVLHAKMPWNTENLGNAQAEVDRIHHQLMTRYTQQRHTDLSDVMTSGRLDTKLSHIDSKIYQGGFEAFDNIRTNKMARGAIMHIDTEFHRGGYIPTQIGWTVTDHTGKVVSIRQFNIGPNAATNASRAALSGKSFRGKPITTNINTKQLAEVVDAMVEELNNPQFRGLPMQIAAKNIPGAEGKVIPKLLEMAQNQSKHIKPENLQQLRVAITSQAIDVNFLPGFMGNNVELKGDLLFKLIQDHVERYPELKSVVLKKLKIIGIPDLGGPGQEIFRKGGHVAGQDSFIQALYADIVHLKNLFIDGVGSRGRDVSRYERAKERLLDGKLPSEFFIAPPKYLSDLPEVDRIPIQSRNLSQASHLGGKVDITETNLTGPLVHITRGADNRPFGTQQLRFRGSKSVDRRIQREIGLALKSGMAPDMPAILKRVLNDISVTSIVLLDPNMNLAKDQFLLSERYLRRNFIYSKPEMIVVDKIFDNIQVGTTLGHGNFAVGTKGLAGEVVSFKEFGGGDTAVVTHIEPAKAGEPRVVHIERKVRIKSQTPALTGSGAANVADQTLEDWVPDIGPRHGAIRLAAHATKEFKANPGAQMTDLFRFLFDHAGLDSDRQMVLRNIISKKFIGGQAGAYANGFPIVRRRGKLDIGHRSYDWWRDFTEGMKKATNESFGFGTYIEIAEEYNRRIGGAFNAVNIQFGAARRSDITVKAFNNNVWAQLARMISTSPEGFVESNIKIARQNLTRKTAPDYFTRVRSTVTALFERGRPQDLFRAMKLLRPDIATFSTNPLDFFSKAGAAFGFFGRKLPSGEMQIAMAQSVAEAFSLKDQTLLSGVGRIMKGAEGAEFGQNFLQALKQVPGGTGKGSLFNLLSDKILTDRSIEISRIFSGQMSTASLAHPRFQEKSARVMSRKLRKFMSAQGFPQHFVPVEEVYRINGQEMNKANAIKRIGIKARNFDQAVLDGLAQLVPPEEVQSRLIRMVDADEMVRLQPFYLGFGQKQANVRIPGTTRDTTYHRLLIQTAESDFFPLEAINKKTGKIELVALQSHDKIIFRGLVNALNSGQTEQNVSELVQEYLNLQNRFVLKANLQTNLDTITVPVGGLGATPIHELVRNDVTTKDKALRVWESVYGQKQVTRDMFLHGKGILPGEELLGGTDDLLIKLVNSKTDNEMKFAANRVLNSVKMMDRHGMHPRGFAMRWIAEGNALAGGPSSTVDFLRKKAQTHLGVLERIINTKGKLGKHLRNGYQDAWMDGFVPMTRFGVKYPVTEPNKFISTMAWRSKVRAENIQKFQQFVGGEVGTIIAEPYSATIKGHIDRDGDLIIYLMGQGEETLKIMKANSNMPELDPIVQIADQNSKGIVTYNTKTGLYEKYPMSQLIEKFPGGIERLKALSIDKQIMQKQLAGVGTIFSENIRTYMDRMLGGDRSALHMALSKGDTIQKMHTQVFELAGALEEAIIQGKATKTAGSDALARMFLKFDFPGFASFRKELLADPSSEITRKITTKIAGTEHLFPGTGGLNGFQLMQNILREGGGDMWQGITPEERILGMRATMGDLYGIRGAMVEAQNASKILQDIPTTFTAQGQETMINSMNREIKREIGSRRWKLASKGMGWMAGIGAVYTAFNVFRPDQTRFLGHMPGQGGEVHDYTFTRPEYNMQNLLNVPYTNPYAKDRSYVVMDNPNTAFKLARFNSREKDDFFKFQRILGIESPRVTSRETQLRVQRNHRDLLEQFGKV